MGDFGPDEAVVDEEILTVLAYQASFAADLAALGCMGQVSKVRTPSGGQQFLTDAEVMRVAVRAALRNLLANRLIVPTGDIDHLNAIFEHGVTCN